MNKINDIRLIDITVIRSHVENPTGRDIQPESVDFSYGFDFGLSRRNKICRVTFDCSIEEKGSGLKAEGIKGSFEIIYLFRLGDTGFTEVTEKNVPAILDFDIALAMANLAYSTSRGIIYTRCEENGIGAAILPVLYTAELEKILRHSR